MLQLADITVLKEYARTGKSICSLFKATRIEDASIMLKPFMQLNPETVMLLVHKWLAERRGKVVMLPLRRHNASHNIMHYVGIKAHERHVYVMYVHDLPSNSQQVTHSWESTATYMNLTEDEIRKSVIRAQDINYFIIARQAHGETLAIDAISELWIPEVEEETIESIDLEAIDELLKQIITS